MVFLCYTEPFPTLTKVHDWRWKVVHLATIVWLAMSIALDAIITENENCSDRANPNLDKTTVKSVSHGVNHPVSNDLTLPALSPSHLPLDQSRCPLAPPNRCPLHPALHRAGVIYKICRRASDISATSRQKLSHHSSNYIKFSWPEPSLRRCRRSYKSVLTRIMKLIIYSTWQHAASKISCFIRFTILERTPWGSILLKHTQVQFYIILNIGIVQLLNLYLFEVPKLAFLNIIWFKAILNWEKYNGQHCI